MSPILTGNIFLSKKLYITGVLHIFYQISYCYALYYERKKYKTNYVKVQIKHFDGPQRVLFLNTYKSKKKNVDKWYLIIDRVARCGLGISERYYQTKIFLLPFWI